MKTSNARVSTRPIIIFFCNFLDLGRLSFIKAVPLDDRTRVHYQVAVFDGDRKDIQGTGRRAGMNDAVAVKDAAVAGTVEPAPGGEIIFTGGVGQPGHHAADVRTLAVDGQET